jgi:hypothetical protein
MLDVNSFASANVFREVITTYGGRSVGIVRSRIQATEFSLV